MTFKRFIAGERIKSISASQINGWTDAAEHVKSAGSVGAATRRDLPPSGVIQVRNDSGATVARFGVLGIDGPVVDPADNLAAFQGRQILSCSTPADGTHRGRFVVLKDRLANGAIGRAWAFGVCPTPLVVTTDTEDLTTAEITNAASYLSMAAGGSAQVLWKESGTGAKWGLVRFGAVTATGLFPVTLTGDGGSAGDDTTQCSFTYTISDAITGAELATSVSPITSPNVCARPSVGAMVAATHGMAYTKADGTLVLCQCNETLGVEDCEA